MKERVKRKKSGTELVEDEVKKKTGRKTEVVVIEGRKIEERKKESK